MFDIGFLELLLLGVVSLVVLGPEKLPGAIRTVSLWIGRLRRSFNSIKMDIEKEIGADEIRRQLRNEAIMDKFKHTKTQVNEALGAVKKETDAIRKSVELEAEAAAWASKPNTIKTEASDVNPADAALTSTSTAAPIAPATDTSARAVPAAASPPATAPVTPSPAPAASAAADTTAKTES